MTISSIALIGILGVAVDIGRLYIAKNEVQIYTDAAALAAATQLNGKTSGLTAARTAVAQSANSWNLNSTNVNTTLEFSNSASGPWASNPANPAGFTYARATLPVQMPLMFLPMIVNRYRQDVNSYAIASQQQITSFGVGLGPYTVSTVDNNGPNFGLVVGGSYSIQWPQFNGTRSGCSGGNPSRCFNSPPCNDDSTNTRWAVASNWGSMTNGYWGFSSNSDIEKSVLNGLQTAPIAVGDNILPIMTNGNKAAQAIVLDQRANQDTDYVSQTPTAYEATTTHNGRRVMLLPVVKPQNSTFTEVVGFAAVLLATDNNDTSNWYRQSTNGNDPFCATYLGPYVIGSRQGGGATAGSGAYRPRLAE